MLDEKRIQELRTMPYQAYLQTPEWQAKREQALESAGHCCQLCNSPDSLNTHHRSYERRGNENLADLIVLCKSCHSLFHDRVPTEEQEHSFHSLSSIAQEFKNQLDSDVSRNITTGFESLDYLLGGFKKSDLIVLGGRPGLGKTSLALNIALRTSLAGNSVAVFSLEMDKQQVFKRLLATQSQMDLNQDNMGEYQQNALSASMDIIADLPIWISDEIATVDSMQHQLHQLIANSRKVDLVIVDYIRLVEPDKYTKRQNAEQQIRAISRSLKLLAREFDIPVLVLCQLSRDLEKRIDKRPLLSDLRDSGAQEEDADVVLLMSSESAYDENLEHAHIVDIIAAKHRNGPTGTTALHFAKRITAFRDIN